jgi:hypothetical protein
MLAADDRRVDDKRAIGLLTAAVATSKTTGERFCEAEILRVRGDRRVAADEAGAVDDYRAAVQLARQQGAKVLELRALTSWARQSSPPESVCEELVACVEDVSSGGLNRSVDEARLVIERRLT